MQVHRNFALGAFLAGVLVLPTLGADAFGTAWSDKQDQSVVAAKAWSEVQAVSSVRFGARAVNWLLHAAENL
jgi:hypothetical protein